MSDVDQIAKEQCQWRKVVAWADARKRARLLALAILDGSARGDEAQELARWVVAELGDG